MAKPQKKTKAPEPMPPAYDDTLVGYARVSTAEQSLQMQIDALIRAGVDPDHIHTEKVSGVSSRRPGRDLALKDCRTGDTFVVWKLDRVGRDISDLHGFIIGLDKRGINFRSLTESIDTKTPIGKLYLALLAAFAQFERDQIQERTKAGVKRAREAGKQFGQPPKVTEKNRVSIERAIHKGLTVKEVAKAHRISESCLRLWYSRADLDEIRAKGPRDRMPTRKTQ